MDPIILPILAQIEETAVGGWLVANHSWFFEGIGASVTLAVLGFMVAFARECLRACGRFCLVCFRAVRKPRQAAPLAEPDGAEVKPTFLFGAEQSAKQDADADYSKLDLPPFLRATAVEVDQYSRVSPDFDPFARSRFASQRHMNLPPRPDWVIEDDPTQEIDLNTTSAPALAPLPAAYSAREPFNRYKAQALPRAERLPVSENRAHAPARFKRKLLSIPRLFFAAAALNALWVLATWLL
jgi:hypothetical protein